MSLGLLGGVALTRTLAHRGAPSRLAATRAEAARPHPLPSLVAEGYELPLPAPPSSWDYRWLQRHPAAGAPVNRSRAALMVELSSGRVLFSRNPHQRMAPASTAKLMTAMVAADSAEPTSVLTVPPEATRVEPNVMGLTAGEKVTIHDLLTGLLLDSGNDAAETLARMQGSRESFIAAMNQRALAMGLSDTQFANPSGLDDPAQFSSPHDLAVVAGYFEEHYPVLAQIAATKEASIRGSSEHKSFNPINLNRLLWSYPGAIGFKTGLTDAAGTCLVVGARRGTRTLLLVELNDSQIFTDATAMLDYGFRRPG